MTVAVFEASPTCHFQCLYLVTLFKQVRPLTCLMPLHFDTKVFSTGRAFGQTQPSFSSNVKQILLTAAIVSESCTESLIRNDEKGFGILQPLQDLLVSSQGSNQSSILKKVWSSRPMPCSFRKAKPPYDRALVMKSTPSPKCSPSHTWGGGRLPCRRKST